MHAHNQKIYHYPHMYIDNQSIYFYPHIDNQIIYHYLHIDNQSIYHYSHIDNLNIYHYLHIDNQSIYHYPHILLITSTLIMFNIIHTKNLLVMSQVVGFFFFYLLCGLLVVGSIVVGRSVRWIRDHARGSGRCGDLL